MRYHCGSGLVATGLNPENFHLFYCIIYGMNPKKLIRAVVPKAGVRLVEQTYRVSRGVFWQLRYGFPARGMHVIAVTGTNGKTTTCSYINEVLKAAGYKTAVYTTAYYEIDGQHTPNRTHMTVTSQQSVQDFFAKARRADVDFVVLEVTSHALHQGRIMGVPVKIAVITNLTQEHLDYHGTMEEYAAAKAILFTKYHPEVSIMNADDEWFRFFQKRAEGRQLSYGQSKLADVRVTNTKLSANGSSFSVSIVGQKQAMNTKLVGQFNVSNILAASTAAFGLGLNVCRRRHEQGAAFVLDLSARKAAEGERAARQAAEAAERDRRARVDVFLEALGGKERRLREVTDPYRDLDPAG